MAGVGNEQHQSVDRTGVPLAKRPADLALGVEKPGLRFDADGDPCSPENEVPPARIGRTQARLT